MSHIMDDRIGVMKNVCKYPKCKNKYYMPIYKESFRNKHFHRFPKNEKISRIWKVVCNIDQSVNTSRFYVCEDHFAPEDFTNANRQRLNPGVIPSGCDNIIGSHQPHDDLEILSIQVSETTDKYSFLWDDGEETIACICLTTDLESRILTMQNIHQAITSKLLKLKDILQTEMDLINKLFCLYENGNFEYITKLLKYVSHEFLVSGLEDIPPLARSQWSKNDLFLTLSLYIKNEKLYKYLSAFFSLPPAKKILENIPFKTGINQQTITSIKESPTLMEMENRICVLLMAEMKLTCGIHYDETHQCLVGYEDLGHHGRCLNRADRVLVLMARGLRNDWTKVISYYFSSVPFKNLDLSSIITLTIKNLQSTGLKIVGLVCEQNQTSLKALSSLCVKIEKQINMFYFFINSERICVIFSAPHLLRETRKLLMRCKILYDEDAGKLAKFEHIERAYNLDQSKRIYKQLDKLKDYYFDADNSSDKTNLEAGIVTFSHTVAGSIETFVHYGDLPEEAMHTAEFVEMMDMLFDSLNGSTEQSDFKKFRCALSASSPHITFWKTVLKQLQKWKLLELKTGEDVSNSYCFIKGWQTTLESLIHTWNCLKSSFDYLSLKQFSLEPLENLFDKIAEHGTHNKSPTCQQFVSALKCQLLNATGDLDDYENLSSLQNFTKTEAADNSVNIKGTYFDNLDFDKLLNMQFHEEAAYLSGYLLQKIDIPDCQTCKSHLLAEWVLNATEVVPPKEQTYPLYATDSVIRLVDRILYHLQQFLRTQSNMSNLEDNFKALYRYEIESLKFCDVHGSIEELITLCIKLGIYRFTYVFNNKVIINK